MSVSRTIEWAPFSDKHKRYIKTGLTKRMCVAEGAIRSGKTIDHCIMAAAYLETAPDVFHLASGSTMANAKLNIGVCNGFGLENLFRGRCHWGKYKDNEALFINTKVGERIVIFVGASKADSYKRILGNSYGLWIATEINEHYDCEDSRSSFIKVANGRQLAAKKPYTLWDLNPCNPRNPIYASYIDKYKGNDNYLYEHFTIADNLSIDAARRLEIETQYDVGSTWYRRDILGERCVAEGLVYRQFAEHPQDFIIDDAPPIMYSVIGVDFGGGTSAHAFSCVGFRPLNGGIVILNEYYNKDALDPERLGRDFCDFVRACAPYRAYDVYCDSAEQTLINGLRTVAAREQLPVNIYNAQKRAINDRIRAACILMSSGRFAVLRRCNRTIDAYAGAVWDSKHVTEDVRLDDGSVNIDSLDATEYAYEREIPTLVGSWKK